MFLLRTYTAYEFISGSLTDPAGTSALAAAVQWLQGTLLGTIATTIAIIAVSFVGLLMLAGRVEIRRGLTVVVGCFILFGAPSVAVGIRSTTTRADVDGTTSDVPVIVPGTPSTSQPLASPPATYDPYAGASVLSN